jgi:hypothetical protein
MFYLVMIVSVLVLFAGCTGQQPAVTPSPATTPPTVSTTAAPTIAEKPVTQAPVVNETVNPRELLVNKSWKVQSWRTEPELDLNNTSVQSFLADYKRRANDTFTWYDNGTLVYKHPNGTVFNTGNWSLAKNNTVIVEKYTTSDGFYLESENEIVSVSKTTFVIRYPAIIAGKEYFFIETQGL